MSLQPFYGDNEHRDYPFITRTEPLDYVVDDIEGESSSESLGEVATLSQELIVDFGAIMEVDSEYLNGEHDYVYLHRIDRSGSVFSFAFRTTAAGARHEECVFDRDLTSAEEFAVEWVESRVVTGDSSGSSDAVTDPCSDSPKWRAFLVTGALDDLLELLAVDGVVRFPRGLWRVEPARIQSLAGTYVRSINLANLPRRIVTPPTGCGDPYAQDDAPIVAAECITGDIRFTEGYNAVIRQESQNGALVFGAAVGAGVGEPCEEVPLYSSESSPDDGSYLTGGPGCDQILRTINGVSARNLVIRPGFGVLIAPATDADNTLVIATDDTVLAACRESSSSESL